MLMAEHPIDLSIVVVNSDGAELTLACLASLYQHPPRRSFEVIVVDNCSREPVLERVNRQFPLARTSMAPRRQGFARNYNQGIQQARGAMVLILNNDTLAHGGSLDTLLDWMDRHPDYGMVGPRVVGVDGRVQPVCARPLMTPLRYILSLLVVDSGFVTGRLWERFRSWQVARRASGPAPCLVGACMLLRRSALDTCGLLDEGYDFYYEDIEWCHRFQQMGWRVGYIAEATITHLGDQSLAKVKVWAKQSEYRSALRYFRQYYRLGPRGAWLIWLVTLLSTLLRGAAFALLEGLAGKQGHARAYFYLWAWLWREGQSAINSAKRDD